MTSLLLLALATSRQEPAPQEAPKPAVLLGQMFARYARAQSLSGKVNFRQVATAQNQRAEITVATEFALQRPGRVWITQKSSKRPNKPYLVTSDGSTFTYEAPRVTLVAQEPDQRVQQPVADPQGKSPEGRVIAMSRISLADGGSPYLALASAWEADLHNLKGQWVTLEDGGSGEVNGTPCRIVKGRWRQAATNAATGKALLPTGVFGIWLTPEGEMLKYSTEETLDVTDENQRSLGKVTVLSEWTGTVTLNPNLPPNIFNVVR